MSSKIHLLCNGKGLPLRLILTAGQVHDVTQAEALLEGQGGTHVIADRGYVSHQLAEMIDEAGAKFVIPPKRRSKIRCHFSKKIYRERNIIERAINKLKQFRRVATRFEKNAANFLAMLHLAAIHLWLR